MARNSLADLNNHLFEQLERMNDTSLSEDEFQKEANRTKVMVDISKSIIDNGRLMLDVMKFNDDKLDMNQTTPALMELEK